MKVHAFPLTHFRGFHAHLPHLPFPWPHDQGGFDIGGDLLLLLVGALLGLLLFVPGVLH